MHKQDWFLDDRYTPSFANEMTMLTRAFERNFNERPFLHHTCYLYLTKTSEDRTRHTGMFSSLTRKHIVPKDMLDEKVIADFFDKSGQFIKILTDSGFFTFKPVHIDQIAGTEEKPGLIEKYLTLSLDGLALQDIDFTDGLKIGNKNCSLFTIAQVDDLPTKVETEIKYEKLSTDRSRFSLGFASHVGLNLPCSHLYNQYIFVDDHNKRMKMLEGKKANLRSLSRYSRENETNMVRTEQFLHDAISGQHLSVRAHFNILVWSEDKEELKKLRNLTGSAVVQMDCRPREATIDIGTLFWSGIPGNAGDFPCEETFTTFSEQASCFLNLETNYRDSPSPFGIKLIDRIAGRPVHVDISDEPMKLGVITNRNKFILGPSGSGKSFFTNHMVRQYHDQGTHILLVDVGHSYKGLCDLVKGVYFTYDEKQPISFNPFFVESREIDVEKKESVKTLLMALWKREGEKVSQAEYSTVSDAVSLYYNMLRENAAVFPCFDTFYDFFDGPFRQLLEQNEHFKERHFDVHNFLYILKRYYKGGEFDFLLNSNKNLDLLHETFIVFELDNIKDHPILFPVVTLIIMETFISKMRKLNGIRKMILIEEAWKAIAKEGTAEFIKYLFKTVRKFFGEAIVVTQEIDDIIGNQVVKDAIINNSDCKILLDQRKFMNRFDQIQTLLGLTEKEKSQVLSINKDLKKDRRYKEVFISLGGQLSKVYAVEVSAEEYITYSTEQKEKIKLFGKKEKYGSIEVAIKESGQEIREGIF
ncbi:TraG family conjugative transposon ATPase [Rhodocytophaga rosea]|uniref:TraG family conjugative transposon ATPase n=1 Tax=Rhodocytophaga rosea TaxID=2704465 RepID=UPI0018DA2EDF